MKINKRSQIAVFIILGVIISGLILTAVVYRPKENVKPEINKIDPINAAKFVIKCLKYQKRNIENLQNSISLSYEELLNFPKESINKLSRFIPEIADINPNQNFTAHNFKSITMGMVNLNEEKISNLIVSQIKDINYVFKSEMEILTYFGYELINERMQNKY